jgi:hypothetical protein
MKVVKDCRDQQDLTPASHADQLGAKIAVTTGLSAVFT